MCAQKTKIWLSNHGNCHDAYSSPPCPTHFLSHQTLIYLVQRLNSDLEISKGKEVKSDAHEINSTTCHCWSLINWLFFPNQGLSFSLSLSLCACRWHPHISFSVGRDAHSDNNWSSCYTFSSACVIITKQNHNYRKTKLFAALLSQLTFPPSSHNLFFGARGVFQSIIEIALPVEV